MSILLKDIKEIYSPNQDLNMFNHVIITDRKIDKILKEIDIDKHNFDKIIDCRNKVILPGLINNHTHSSMSILRGYADDLVLDKWLKDKIWPAEAKLTEKDIYWGAMLAVLEMIKTGTTTFTDMYFHMDKVAEVVEKSGIRAVLGEGLIEENDGLEGLNNSLEFALDYNNKAEGRIKTCMAPHSAYTCTPKYLKEISNVALENDLLVNIHVSETEDEVNIIKDNYNTTTVQLLEDIGLLDNDIIAPHCVYVNDKDIKLLKKKNVGVVYNPSSNMKLSSGIAPISELLDNDINVSYGTDSAASNNNLDLIEEARMGSYLQKVSTGDPRVLPIEANLKMLTLNAAQIIGYSNLGEIKEGYLADLVLIDTKNIPHQYPSYNYLSNIFYAGNGGDVDTVIVNGEVLMENMKLITIDEQEVYKNINDISKKYL
jgi:5-methylthioadenosine/S-adenosylhomocysteine deaminase